MKRLIIVMVALLLISNAYAWEWIRADELKGGDRLMAADGSEITISSIENAEGNAYYIETDKGNYFADGILVKSMKEDGIGKNKLTGMAGMEMRGR